MHFSIQHWIMLGRIIIFFFSSNRQLVIIKRWSSTGIVYSINITNNINQDIHLTRSTNNVKDEPLICAPVIRNVLGEWEDVNK